MSKAIVAYMRVSTAQQARSGLPFLYYNAHFVAALLVLLDHMLATSCGAHTVRHSDISDG
jgi:hypothetical protein